MKLKGSEGFRWAGEGKNLFFATSDACVVLEDPQGFPKEVISLARLLAKSYLIVEDP